MSGFSSPFQYQSVFSFSPPSSSPCPVFTTTAATTTPAPSFSHFDASSSQQQQTSSPSPALSFGFNQTSTPSSSLGTPANPSSQPSTTSRFAISTPSFGAPSAYFSPAPYSELGKPSTTPPTTGGFGSFAKPSTIGGFGSFAKPSTTGGFGSFGKSSTTGGFGSFGKPSTTGGFGAASFSLSEPSALATSSSQTASTTTAAPVFGQQEVQQPIAEEKGVCGAEDHENAFNVVDQESLSMLLDVQEDTNVQGVTLQVATAAIGSVPASTDENVGTSDHSEQCDSVVSDISNHEELLLSRDGISCAFEASEESNLPHNSVVFVEGMPICAKYANIYHQIHLRHGHICASISGMPSTVKAMVFTAIEQILKIVGKMEGVQVKNVGDDLLDDWEAGINYARRLDLQLDWLVARLEDLKAVRQIGLALNTLLDERRATVEQVDRWEGEEKRAKVTYEAAKAAYEAANATYESACNQLRKAHADLELKDKAILDAECVPSSFHVLE